MNIPTPKYAIGDKVWNYYTTHVEREWPCPDCLGTKKWAVSTPAGGALIVACPRCSGRNIVREMPSLRYTARTAAVRELTIGSVRIDTAETDRDKVSYMCVETGVGSGSVYNESMLFATEAECKVAGDAVAAVETNSMHSRPEFLHAKDLGKLHMQAAVDRLFHDSTWAAWYHFRELRREFAELLASRNVEPPNSWEDGSYHIDEFAKTLSGTLGAASAAGEYDEVVRLLKEASASIVEHCKVAS
ncbi:hypothetical protein [Sphingomonas sp.]|jgi:hypothetical protein|uniref:hypothetical protein n=1 Tax=Sphingomonas sp. TaxID=28214 RepID=UPI00356AFE7B